MDLSSNLKKEIDKTKFPRWISAQVQDDLKNLSESQVLEKLMSNGYGFNHETFDQLRKKRDEQDLFVASPFDVEEGIVECGKCKGKKVVSVSVQTRAADEPMTTMSFCVTCKHKWKQN